jgi:hypothetical protein
VINHVASGLVSLALIALLLGCTSSPLLPATAAVVPDVRGTWTGSWGGSPLSLVVIDQTDDAAESGIYLGSFLLLGNRTPGVTGVMTSTIAMERVSVNIQGWFGYTGTALTLVLRAATGGGDQTLRLTAIGERLVGTGSSNFRWGPQGRVELTRQVAPPDGKGSAAIGKWHR